MSDAPKKTLTPAQRLQLFALLIAAGQRYGDCRKLERAALQVLGRQQERFLNDHLGDMLYQLDEDGAFSEGMFDEALRRDGYEIEPDPLEPIINEADALARSLNAAEEAKSDPIFNYAASLIRRLSITIIAERKRQS